MRKGASENKAAVPPTENKGARVRALMPLNDARTGEHHAAGDVWQMDRADDEVESLVALGLIELVKEE